MRRNTVAAARCAIFARDCHAALRPRNRASATIQEEPPSRSARFRHYRYRAPPAADVPAPAPRCPRADDAARAHDEFIQPVARCSESTVERLFRQMHAENADAAVPRVISHVHVRSARYFHALSAARCIDSLIASSPAPPALHSFYFSKILSPARTEHDTSATDPALMSMPFRLPFIAVRQHYAQRLPLILIILSTPLLAHDARADLR